MDTNRDNNNNNNNENNASIISAILDNILDEIELKLSKLNDPNNSVTENNLSQLKISSSYMSTISGLDNINCRICYDSNSSSFSPIVFPCKCKGTIGAIHLKCLEQWLEESNRSSCELCGHEFQTERTLRYSALQSIPIWICLGHHRHRIYVRNLHSDLLRCLLITPLIIVCSYICIVAADFYSNNKYENFPPARWTTYSILAMMTLIIISYFVWMYTALGYHQRIWFYWWQKTSVVKVHLPVDCTKQEN